MASLVVAGDTSGSVTLSAPSVSGSTVLTLPTTTGTLVVTGGAQTIEFADGSAAAPSITNSGDTNTGMFFPAADTIAFSEGGTESMRIDASGQVGIGTTSPTGKLDVSSSSAGVSAGDLVVDTANKTVYVGRQSSTSGDNSYLVVRGRLNGSGTNQAIVITGDTSAYGTGIFRPGNDIIGFSTLATERMRIDSSGNLLVGTSSHFDSAYTMALQVRSSTGGLVIRPGADSYTAISFRNAANSQIGSITTTASATAYNTSSDYRLKENIAPMTGALAKVAALNPVTYTWKTDGSDGQGFIAHELQAVVPECVTGEKDAVETYTDEEGNEQTRIKPQGVDTSFLVATLTAAIQEQQQIINDLKARIETLEGAK